MQQDHKIAFYGQFHCPHKTSPVDADCCLKELTKHYPIEQKVIISDGGRDIADVVSSYSALYHYSEYNCMKHTYLGKDPRNVGEYLSRLRAAVSCFDHDTDWVVLLEEDVRTIRRAKNFPETTCAGPRMNRYPQQFQGYLKKKSGHDQVGFGLCGGSIVRYDFLRSLFEGYSLDDLVKQVMHMAQIWYGMANYQDAMLPGLFIANDATYGVWEEVSETTHKADPIVRNSAFDHCWKKWPDTE